MIDATTCDEALSFRDCTASYTYIQMALQDQDDTSFYTLKGTFCDKIMSFGLKNTGATYQRLMQTIFENM